MIEVIHKELYNAKVLILETLIPTPSMDKIKITIFKPNLIITNPKLVIVTQSVSIIN